MIGESKMMSKPNKQIRTAILAPGGMRADAALYFVGDEMLFHGVSEQGAEQIKFLPSATCREAFAKEPLDSGWLPPGVNRYGTGSRGVWMVRWHPPAMYAVRLDDRKTPLRVPMPSLIWFGQKHHYYIFAARERDFTPNAALYHAPMANVNHYGLICFGKNAHPDVAKGGFDPTWRTFWDAPFNNDHDDGKSKAFPDAVNDHLCQLARAKATEYPLKDLVSMNTSLNGAIERLTKRGNEWD
jgi:PRTRC genetic system protein B